MAMSVRSVDRERLYTPEEFEALPEFAERYELSDGKLVQKPMPGDEHFRIILALILAFSRFDPSHQRGMFWSQTSIDFGRGWIPLPDFAFMLADRVPFISAGSVKGVPDLVAEVHSPSDLDTTPGRNAAQSKIEKYQSYGVKVIWGINPRTKTVEVFGPDQIQPLQSLGIGKTLTGGIVLPDFKLPVRKLFQ